MATRLIEAPSVPRATRRVADPPTRPGRPASLGFRASAIIAALLSIAVVVIHVKDQGGLLTMRDPTYLGIGYFLLEGAGIAAAAVLLSRLALRSWAWLLALGVAAGPFFGFLLSRGPGLPSAMDDRGNWTEPLGLMSAVVEGILMLLAVAAFVRTRSGAAVRQS